MFDLFELGELFLSWRLYLGLAITVLICWAVVAIVSSQTAQILVCVPIGIIGFVMSWRWQVRADSGT